MTPRRVLIVQPHREWGGPGALLRQLVQAFDPARYVPYVAAPAGSEMARRYRFLRDRLVLVEGLATIPRTFRPDRMGRYVARSLAQAWELARLCRDEGIDLVHSWTEAVWVGGMAARMAGLPSVGSSIDSTTFHPLLVGWGLAQVQRVLSDMLLPCQETNRRMFRRLGIPGERLRVVFNCTDASHFTPPSSRDRTGPPRIGMISGLYPIKGQQDFIEALGVLASRGRDFRAFLIGPTDGNPEYLAHLHARIEALGIGDRVTFTGFLEDVRPMLASLHIYAVPSRFEALSGACLEAMAMELPVVATDVGGNKEAVAHGVTGLVVPPRDPVAMADALERLMGSPELQARMGEAGRRRVLERFDLPKSVDALLGAYDEALERFAG